VVVVVVVARRFRRRRQSTRGAHCRVEWVCACVLTEYNLRARASAGFAESAILRANLQREQQEMIDRVHSAPPTAAAATAAAAAAASATPPTSGRSDIVRAL
jgi:hypothetical protein